MKRYLSVTVFLLCMGILWNACEEKEPLKGATNKIVITTNAVSSISADSALGGGTITEDGGDVIRERGICWDTVKAPVVADSRASSGSGKGSFSVRLRALLPNTTYYVRAYSISEQGEVYGNEQSFKTPIQLPGVSTGNITAITGISATGSGSVQSDGGGSISERGVCWSATNTNPQYNDNRSVLTGSGAGTFTVPLTNLMANTTYWVRAFARNSAGTGYGTVISFRTGAPSVPVVGAVTVSSITRNSVIATSSITGNGGAVLSQYGFCISTFPTMNPRTCFWGSGDLIGNFTRSITGLQPNTTYYIRAYGVNAAGEGSSTATVSFTTLPPNPPTVTTATASSPTATTFTAGGTVVDDGGASITARGVIWSVSSAPAIGNGTAVPSGSGTGSYTTQLTNLPSNRTIFYRAYAQNAGGFIGYGTERTANTRLDIPILSTPATNANAGCCYLSFTWQAVSGATSYELQLSRDANFAFTTSTMSVCGSSSYPSTTRVNMHTTTVANACLNAPSSSGNGIWYWRVRALSTSNSGDWSAVRYFNYRW
jgi:hypothetical protein